MTMSSTQFSNHADQVLAAEISYPNAASPVIRPQQVRDETHPIPSFGDDTWNLSALGRAEGSRLVNIYWRAGESSKGVDFPPTFREPARHAAYVLINDGTHRSVVDRRWSSASKWLAPSSLYKVVRAWALFAEWLTADGIIALADIDADTLEAYQRYVQELDSGAGYKAHLLHSIWRLHGCAEMMPVEHRLVQPPWSETGSGIAFQPRGENRTVIIAPDTMDSTIIWAIRFIRDFAPDILAARDVAMGWIASIPAEPRSMGTGPGGRHARGQSPSRAQARAFLNEYLPEHGWRVPATTASTKELAIAQFYLSARYGQPNILSEVLREEFKGRYTLSTSDKAEVGTPIHGRVNGQPWIDYIDFYDVAMNTANYGMPTLLMHLRTACLIAASYLTGMRPNEVITLKHGCVSEVPPNAEHPEGINGFVIAGTLRKHVRTKDGRQDIDGVPREWGTVRHGANALLLAEKISLNRRYLFGSGSDGLKTTTLNRQINGFNEFVNSLVDRLGLPAGYLIPADADGPLNITRFRRSIAHHVQEQPDGEYALGQQYHHFDPDLGRDGYSSMASAGERRQMDRDAAEARMKTFREVEELLTQGGGISGPAAPRLVSAVEAAAPLQATYLSDSEVKRLVNDPAMQVYDNPGQYSLCLYQASTARCSTSDSPDRGSCDKHCANHARTDKQIDNLRREEGQHRAESESPLAPKPVRLRLQHRADIERELIERHERDRVSRTHPEKPNDTADRGTGTDV